MFRAGLCLKDGKCWEGTGFGAVESMVLGEVCFTTAMTGYTETLTDPSYRDQILIFTYPMLGNYGVCKKDFQSDHIQTKGIIVGWVSPDAYHYTSETTFEQWVTNEGIFGLCDVDTRSMVLYLREHGTMLGTLYKIETVPKIFPRPSQTLQNVVAKVSCREPYAIRGSNNKTVLVVDCGVKRSILKALTQRGFNLLVVPYNAKLSEYVYDAIVFSNGPGDPNDLSETIEQARLALKQNKPILGICLGHQVLALAAGASVSKLKFGHRGVNQPIIDITTGKGYITSHNHGFTVDNVPNEWQIWFRHMHDQTIEGLRHGSNPFFTVQFHPEGKPGPLDCESLVFDAFADAVFHKDPLKISISKNCSAKRMRKVLLLGSGGLTIGQAGEFDYSGAQAIKALKQERVHTVLVNPNIASVQTSMADTTYYYPLQPEYVDRIIAKEGDIDGVMLQFGGQTALNCGLGLKSSSIRILGTSRDSIIASEDRTIFAQKMREIGEQCAPSVTVHSYEEALTANLGYPVLIRTNFSLGGAGSGFARDPLDLKRFFPSESPLIMDKSLYGYKEIEVEVLHDVFGNAVVIAICENVDPTGIHTADSVVVAPAQTLTNDEYFSIRNSSLNIVRHLNIIGECNIQFAICPKTSRYFVIEANPRLSRSSALVSKVTGISLAFLAAQLCLGYSLLSLTNDITRTTAFFEPAMDYCVVKVPRWDMDKFVGANRALGSAMKSIGEGLAVGRNFREAFDSALHSTNGTYQALEDVKNGQMTLQQAHATHAIDQWFLSRLSDQNRVDHPYAFAKHIDTCAGEFPCFTNYLYLTRFGSESERVPTSDDIVILGSGPYRIGSSCEFDWSAVQAMRSLKRLRRGPIVMVNNNSATVSTDYQEADVLYLTEVCMDNIKAITHKDASIVVSVGGQTANNLVQDLKNYHILGSSPNSIHKCEDRGEFATLLDTLSLPQPPWASVSSKAEIIAFASRHGYPLLMRPSYVLSGTAMRVIYDESEIMENVKSCTITKFVQEAKEIECDAVADRGKMIACVASEKIELAGTHSGDSSLILPPQRLYVATLKQVYAITSTLAKALKITGPFNVQYLSKDNAVQVIECNLRASRSLPFVCKTFRVNFMDLAIRAMLDLEPTPIFTDVFATQHVCVKVPMFSFHRIADADPIHSIEMVSTGEVAGFGRDVFTSFRLAMESAGFRFPPLNGKIFVCVKHQRELNFQKGDFQLFATYDLNHAIKITKQDALKDGFLTQMNLVICVGNSHKHKLGKSYAIRRQCIDKRVPLVTNMKVARMVLGAALRQKDETVIPWEDYVRV